MRLYGERYEEKLQLIESLKYQIATIKTFVLNHVEEGPRGPILNLTPEQTEELMKRIKE